MSRNRIIHNVQDIFIGSHSGETSDVVTGAAGAQVLQRIERIQTFNYDLTPTLNKSSVLGKSHHVVREYDEPAQISLAFNYYSYGVNNEERMGFNADSIKTKNSDKGKNIIHDIALNEVVGRNIYLVVNNQSEDLHHGNKEPYPDKLFYKTGFLESDVIDPKSPDYSVVVFQNCFLDSYVVNGRVNELTSIEAAYTADNMIAYSSGSGINITYLDLKKGEVTDTIASVYTSDFCYDANGWTAANASLFQATSCMLRYRADTATSSKLVQRTIFTIGKRYKVTGKVYVNGTNPILKSVRIHDGYGVTLDNITDQDQWVSFDVELTAVSELLIFYGMNSVPDYNWASAGTIPYDEFFIKDIVVTEVKEFIIPNHFDRKQACLDNEKLLSKPAHISLEISQSPAGAGLKFQTDNIQDFSIGCPVPREPSRYVGHKMITNKMVSLPLEGTATVSLLSTEIPTGSFLDNTNSKTEYNITIDCKDEDLLSIAVYTISGAKLESVSYDSSVGANRSASLDFSTSMDLDNHTKGVFLSGVVSTICAGIHWHDDDEDEDYTLVTNDGKYIIDGEAMYPRY